MERTQHLIVGAGITGLAFADWLTADDYLVVEAEHEPGGYCRTVRQDGFVWDYSGHFFHFRDPEVERYLVARMGDQPVRVVEKHARVHVEGTLVDFPFQKNIHQLPKDAFVDCLVDLFFKDEAYPPDRPAGSFREMLYQKFGRGIAERMLVPYNEKLYACDLADLDVDAMGRFFPYADVPDIIRNFRGGRDESYNATFTYPEGGAYQYVLALLAGVDASRMSLGERVLSIDPVAKVARTSEREIAFDHLLSTMPFPRLLDICGINYEPSTYSWNKVLVFNLGFDRKGLEDTHWVYFPSREVAFYRVGFYDNIFGTDRMSLYVEIGYPADTVLDDAAIEAMRQRVLADLTATGVVDGHTLESWHSVVLDPAYVHITEASRRDVAEKRRQLAHRGIHSGGRYGAWTYCSIEDNILEARALADSYNAIVGAGISD